MKPPGTLRIWTIDDGRAGLASQTRALAEAIAALLPAKTSTKRVVRRPFSFGVLTPAGDMVPPWPDLCVGCGRASIGYMKAMRRWSAEQTMTVQLQDPRCNPDAFDLVIPPEHDGLRGENVFPIIGAPVRSTAPLLNRAKEDFAARMAHYPRPRLAVALGGNTPHYNFSRKAGMRLQRGLQGLVNHQVSLLITTSRRTPRGTVKRLRTYCHGKQNVWLWTGADGDGPNPYFAFLQAADAVLVSNDSTNMITDAASAGRPVLLFDLDGKNAKLERFHDSLARRGLLRPFTGSLTTWPVTTLNETRRAAEETLRRFHMHRLDHPRKQLVPASADHAA